MQSLASRIAEKLMPQTPEIEDRVKHGIEQYRKGFGEIVVKNADGEEVESATIGLKLIKHEFHFGCNGFMYNQFDEKERNDAHNEAFKKIFNLVVVPFYWSDLEPVEGKPRFDKNSPLVYRRPVPDDLLEFCELNDIIPKGHPLTWRSFNPSWLPMDNLSIKIKMETHVARIAARYKERIKFWDVCNEALGWFPYKQRMPENHVEFAFELATKYFPRNTTLAYNDYLCWEPHGEYTPFYMLGRHLKSLPVNFNAMGLQFHMFSPEAKDLLNRDRYGNWCSPLVDVRNIIGCLDQYAKLGLPLNISEITIPARRELGNQFQKDATEYLYRLWFSHPAMNGIVWWNLIDGTAAYAPQGSEEGENRYRGGLLNYDLSSKPSYEVLDRLINKEWTTNETFEYQSGAVNSFKGFYGKYEISIKTDTGVFKDQLVLSKNSFNKFDFKIVK